HTFDAPRPCETSPCGIDEEEPVCASPQGKPSLTGHRVSRSRCRVIGDNHPRIERHIAVPLAPKRLADRLRIMLQVAHVRDEVAKPRESTRSTVAPRPFPLRALVSLEEPRG